VRHAYGNAYGNANGDGAVADCDSDGDGHIHADSDCDGNSHADSDANGDIYGYGNRYGYSHSDGNLNRIPAAYTHATASADPAASPLACCGIKGTRGNELASSQLEVDRSAAADDAKLIFEGHITRQSGLCLRTALRSRRGDRISFGLPGPQGCSVRCPQRDSGQRRRGSSPVSARAEFMMSPGGIAQGLMESKTPAPTARFSSVYGFCSRLSGERRGGRLPQQSTSSVQIVAPQPRRRTDSPVQTPRNNPEICKTLY